MNTTVGRTKLEIVSADITRLDVDAIAVPARTDLRMEAGLAAAVKRAGGEMVEREAVLQGPVAVGEAVVTTGHDLPVPWVVHVAVMAPRGPVDANAVARATRAALDAADRAHARSLALPAFGTGIGGFPLYQCASVMLAETVAWLREHPRTGLRRIFFCAYDEAARAAFTNALAGVSRF